MSASPHDWLVPAWNGPANVRAWFTTRHGGVSTGLAATMDTGPAFPTPDDLAGAIGENRRRLRAHLPSDPVWLSQVHGRNVVLVTAQNVDSLRERAPEGDAAVTREAGVVLTVRTADCLPVLFADARGSVLGVAHAGWRGLVAGVLEATVAAMAAQTPIAAWLGPAIGPRAFEVGADVRDAFCADDAGCARLFSPQREGKWLADLPGLARHRLRKLGIDAAGGTWCTLTDSERFFSWRRDKSSGRMALVAWLDDRD